MDRDKSLEETLKGVGARGIGVDRRQLRRNICSQFPDYRLWIREFIVNAYDAGARNCHISGSTDGKVHTIEVRDDGHGMNRAQIESFLIKFRSTKDDPERAVGKFGIGSFSIAAIPEQCGFSVVTATGSETWRFTAGSLFDDAPIRVDRLADVRPRGTTFRISFRAGELGLAEEMSRLAALARKHVYFLPINVFFHGYGSTAGRPTDLPHWKPGHWGQEPGELMPKRFCFQLRGATYDAVLALGPEREAIYQKGVLITEGREDHSLLKHDPFADRPVIRHLTVRVESDAFELPLGRHCLSNTFKLAPLARHIRESVLPDFVDDVIRAYDRTAVEPGDLPIAMVETFLCDYLAMEPRKDRPVNRVRLFRAQDGRRLSFSELEAAVKAERSIYLEGAASGLDYAAFEGPVLAHRQPGNALEFVKSYFGDYVVNLTLEDLVQEPPTADKGELSETERRFSQCLGLHPAALKRFTARPRPNAVGGAKPDPFVRRIAQRFREEISTAARRATDNLESIKWRVNRLVGRDGVTPCKSVLYICRGRTVTLNLNHPEIRGLVRLSETTPQLAAHFAVAQCLTTNGKNSILPQLPAEDREDLINLDAVVRCGEDAPPANAGEQEDSDASGERGQAFTPEEAKDFNLNSMMDDLPF